MEASAHFQGCSEDSLGEDREGSDAGSSTQWDLAGGSFSPGGGVLQWTRRVLEARGETERGDNAAHLDAEKQLVCYFYRHVFDCLLKSVSLRSLSA